jgi:hypothetical protein
MTSNAGKGERTPREIPPDDEAVLADDEPILEGNRHYLHDPDGIRQNARDADERDLDDVLEIDQTELAELGLALDDPHQPEPE